MIGDLLVSLSRALDGSPGLALAAACGWGVASVLLSPCHLASIPLVIGYLGSQSDPAPGKAFRLSLLFASGILVTIAALGAVTAALGRMLGDFGPAGTWVLALVFLVVGLHLLGVLPLPFSGPGAARSHRRGAWGAFVLGLVFGLALGPCTFAFLAPMLAIALRSAAGSAAWGVLLLVAYGIGHCGVIAAAGTSSGAVQRYLDWGRDSRAASVLRRACGGLVLAGGGYLVWANL